MRYLSKKQGALSACWGRTLSASRGRALPARGFTLLEMVLVLFIAGVMVSLAAVAFSRTYEKAVFKEDVKKVFVSLKRARDTAIMERAVFTFNIAEEGGEFWIEKDGSAYGGRIKLSSGVKAKGERIEFFPKGDSSGGEVEVEGQGERKYVIEVDSVSGGAKVKRL